MGREKKQKVSVQGPWQPVSLAFLRSRACAQLSPQGAKLFIDLLAMMGPNAARNGDLSLAPSVMKVRGWRSRATLEAAAQELVTAKLLCQTRQGGRKDCSLWALTLYPLYCDLRKLDVGPGCYSAIDYAGPNQVDEKPPSTSSPAVWRVVRKNTLACPVAGQKP